MAITNGYCTLAQLKNWMNITDTVDDPILETAIEAASRAIDKHTHRRFYLDSSATARTYRAENYYVLRVHDIGSTSGLIVKTDSAGDGTFSTTIASTDYQVEPGQLSEKPYTTIRLFSGLFPIYVTGRYGVQITAKWGWPSVPTDIVQATVILASRFVKRKDSPEGVLGFGELGAVRIAPTDRDVKLLCDPFRRLDGLV